MSEITLSDHTLELVARRFRYLGEPFRLRLLQSLSKSEKTVTELVEALNANQPNVSKHLNLLLEGGLVARRKQGTSSIYSVADPLIFTLCDLVCKGATSRTKKELAALQEGTIGKRSSRK
ncbi:MAG: metalloregulator ArsR/SmtB family transcription factor [Edaphobacter sp.]